MGKRKQNEGAREQNIHPATDEKNRGELENGCRGEGMDDERIAGLFKMNF